MKHRHKLAQAQRRKAAPRNRRFEVDEAADEPSQPAASRAKKHSMHHMHAEGGRTKRHQDKFRRGGRSTKRYDSGGSAGSSAGSTRTADDPGAEISAANRGRKSTADWIRDEILGGTKPAYQRGGRQKRYAAGGAPPGGGAAPPIAAGFGGGPDFSPPTGMDFVAPPRVNQIVAMVRKNLTPKPLITPSRPPPPFPGPPTLPGSKQGGRIRKNPKSTS